MIVKVYSHETTLYILIHSTGNTQEQEGQNKPKKSLTTAGIGFSRTTSRALICLISHGVSKQQATPGHAAACEPFCPLFMTLLTS